MEIIAIITFVLSIVLLIAFFRLTSNVRDIKELIISQVIANRKTAYYVHSANKNVPQATEALLTLIFSEIMEKDYTLKERYHLFEQSRDKYEPFFKRLGMEYPINPFGSVDHE